MSSKEKPGVTRRLNRGRSTPDSKSKTDSGCFVDEELERNGSSDSSQGSINSSPVKEKDCKKAEQLHKESKPNTLTPSVLPSEAATFEENASKNCVVGKENVMNGDITADDKNETSVKENVDSVCDVVEKTRQSSDFYCLYYSASPEGTLTKSDAVKLRDKPPVPPKPKLRRGSAPPSTLNHVERISNQNKDITKRFSYNEGQSDSDLSTQQGQKRKSVDERVLFFEGFAKDDSFKSPLFKNVQAANFRDLSDVLGGKDLDSENPSGLHVVQNGLDVEERTAPLANNEEFSFKSNSGCEFANFGQEAHIAETFVPLAEEDAFSINGSSYYHSSLNGSNGNDNSHSSESGRKCLDCVNEVDEIEDTGHLIVDENQNGVKLACHQNDHQFSDAMTANIYEDTVTDVQTKDSCNLALQNGMECFEVLTKEGNLMAINAPSCSSDSNMPVPSPENEQGTGFSKKLVNPRLNEIKEELLVSSRHSQGNKMLRRPGSFAGLPDQDKDVSSSELKRRSWSVSELTHPMDSNSPFVSKVYPVPAPKLATSLWHSESGLSSPSVCSEQQKQPKQSPLTSRNIVQRKIGQSVDSPASAAQHLDYSGYTSDDSSVHSEPLFQPLRRQPQSLNNGRILKSMSVDSNIFMLDNGASSLSKVQRRRVRHSLGSRDPIFALRRQSVEFAEEEKPPSFRPVSPVQLPHLQTLRRTSSCTSSSSDSEVEKIFREPEASTSRYHRHRSGHIGLVSNVTHRKVSAMEALFGPQSVSPNSATLNLESEQTRRKSLSERFSEIPSQPAEEDFFCEELEEDEIAVMDEKVEEPGLEFDDTDYSEFYTRCEDKESIITAEALSIKKLLQSPITVLPDPDIESVVMSVTERQTPIPTSDKEEFTIESQNAFLEDDNLSIEDNTSELETTDQFYRQHRGTQTPPPEVFKALSPPPSVATQTPPLPVSQELSSSLLKELELQVLTPTISKASPTTSLLQELHSPLLNDFEAVSPRPTPATNTDLLSSFQEADKAVSVEELLQILANLPACSPTEAPSAPPRRPVSVQKYNSPSLQSESSKSSKIPKSLPSSWQHLSSPTGKQNGSESLKNSTGVPPRSSKSYDCLRRGLSSREKRSDTIQAKMVKSNESSENIRKKLKEWKLRSQLFEEEVECLEDKGNKHRQPLKPKEEKALKVSYEGSESTDNIETQSKLTNTHSLKRPRKDRAFSQKERNFTDVSSFDEKLSFPLTSTRHDSLKSKGAKDSDGGLKESSSSCGEDKSELEFTSFADRFQSNEPLLHEVASPEGVDIFIDYRKKHGMHITSTPKPPPDPDKNVSHREDRVGKINFEKLDDVHSEKPLITTTAEDKFVPTDVESQGDASSSSYSSDDDHFGEFGGSTETVVFVDTEPNPEISLISDLETLDMNLVGGDKLLAGKNDDDDDQKDESRLDALLGEVRRSLNLEFVDSDILDKAIDRFKQRVSPNTQTKALCGGLSMEAYVALHQADELQGIISEIKGELKLLHDENDMLREQVVTLANYQTNGEVTENSSTESSERLENLYKLYKVKHGDTDDEDAVEIDVCLRGFSTMQLGHLPFKKKDIRLGTVSVKGADWNGVMEAAKKTFVEHMRKVDPEDYLCLGAHSIRGVQTGVVVWSPGSLKRSSPRVELSDKSNPCVIQLKDGSHFSCDSLVYDTLLPKEAIENYVEQLLEHRCIVLCGQQGLGKAYLASKLAEHVVQRIGWKSSPAVATFNVTQQTRKELKRDLASLMQNNLSSSNEGTPAVIILDQLNCLASLADIFDFSQLEKNSSCPYIIGVRDKSRKGPFSSKELSLCHYFRWLRVSINDRQYSGLLNRFLRRKLSWSQIQTDVEGGDLLELFDWLSIVWQHLNEILEDFCDADSTIGPSLFFSCPMDFKAAEGWFVNVWNYNVIPYLHQALRSGRKIFDRCASWEDPTKWVVLRYPWNKDHSRVFHTLRKLRQVDVVLNRNQLGSDNVSFAECIGDNEKILRAHSTVSKRVRTVVQEKIPKAELKEKRKTAELKESHRDDEDRESSYSESDSYLETSI